MRVPARREVSDEPEANPFELLGAERRTPAAMSRSALHASLLAVQVAFLLAMTATVATKVWQDHYWFGWGLCAVTAVAWLPELAKPRARRWWFAYVAGIFFYTLLRAYAGRTVIPPRTGYVIDFDHMIFLGRDPTTWLQERLFSPAHIGLLDIATVQVHWSFFIAPHLMAAIIFIWRRDLFPRYVALVVGIMYAGLLVFFLVPTTPPWLAAQAGHLVEGYRVMDFVGGKLNDDTYRSLAAPLAEPNPVAAMPSIHMAVTFAMYLWARDNGYRKIAWWLLGYSAVMAFSLVYLAEHYVLDLLAGVACAVVCHALSRRFVAVHAFEEADGRT
jgi:membrane-associated phospholipid phosphatase